MSESFYRWSADDWLYSYSWMGGIWAVIVDYWFTSGWQIDFTCRLNIISDCCYWPCIAGHLKHQECVKRNICIVCTYNPSHLQYVRLVTVILTVRLVLLSLLLYVRLDRDWLFYFKKVTTILTVVNTKVTDSVKIRIMWFIMNCVMILFMIRDGRRLQCHRVA